MGDLGYFVQATASGSGYIQSLSADYLPSQNGDYYAVMQVDGNFCAYKGTFPYPIGNALFCTGSNQPCQCFYFAAVQSDGNFCVYSGAPGSVLGNALWCSGTGGNPSGNYFLTMENDGDLNLYEGTPEETGSLLWSSDGGIAAAAREARQHTESSPASKP